VEADITHIGIRAHDFRIAHNENYNLIRPAVKTAAEEPFEQVVIFTNADARNDSEQGELWWKYSKYLDIPKTPDRLFLPPGALLLLKSGEKST
jgi:predicted ATP-grasp superfamily ATP-dependent carboligase